MKMIMTVEASFSSGNCGLLVQLSDFAFDASSASSERPCE
jgi:hypothetical protein